MWELRVGVGRVGRTMSFLVLSVDLQLLVAPDLKTDVKKKNTESKYQSLTFSVVGWGSSWATEETFKTSVGVGFC